MMRRTGRGLQRTLLSILAILLLCGCQAATGGGGQEQAAGAAKWVNEYVDGQGKSGIKGQVTLKEGGQPLEGAFVNIYPDAISNLLGPSQFLSNPTDASGRYDLDVPPGTYYIVARKRVSGQPTGPLSPGDYYSEHQRILTRVVDGKFSVVDLPVVAMKAPMFFKNRMGETETSTGIRGVLVDQNGKPVPGGFAMAYSDQGMKRLPDYASTLSDQDGKFTLYLPEGGTFFLSARINAWDMPRPGEPYGKYGGDPPTAVTIETDAFVEGVTIVMSPYAGEYKEGKSQRPF